MRQTIREGRIPLDDTFMSYVCFGKGDKPLVILPGLSDGLKSVRGSALALSLYYRLFAKHYRIFIFSRKDELDEGYTTMQMAEDQMRALEYLELTSCSLMGISQGGMIAEYLAIDHPQLVDRLVLAVTTARPYPILQEAVDSWIRLAERGMYRELIIDTMERTYSEKRLRRYRPLYPILSRLGRPKEYTRFLIQAHSCLEHDAYELLERIECPTLVIGGEEDLVVGPQASPQMAKRIPNSHLITYEGLGHGAFDETKAFNTEILRFLGGQ